MPKSAYKDARPESGAAREEAENRRGLPEILRAWRDQARARTGLALEVEHDEEEGRVRIHDISDLHPTRDVVEAVRLDFSNGSRWAVKHFDADWVWLWVGGNGHAMLWHDLLDAAADCFDALIDAYATLRRAHIEGLSR